MTRLLSLRAPFAGEVRMLADVPDEVFASGMLGEGVAIEPSTSAGSWIDAVAPCDGAVVALHPHAFVLDPGDGFPGVLVHLGIDTLREGKECYTPRIELGGHVSVGDVVTSWSPVRLRALGYGATCPIVALSAPREAVRLAAAVGASVGPGDLILTLAPAPPQR